MELFMDDFHVDYTGTRNAFLHVFASEETIPAENQYLWMSCRRLERLSFKHATWKCSDMTAPEPVTQQMLMKMVRHHSNLRWLRSDLTAENVSMLKQERPEITFAMD